MDTTNLAIRRNDEVMKKVLMVGVCAIIAVLLSMVIIYPAFAEGTGAEKDLKTVLDSMIDVIGLIFRVIGVLLVMFAVGQMVLAFKNEDPDSKSKAATLLAVGMILIFIKTIITSLNLTSYITS